MKKLHIFILKSYIGPFIMTFFIALFILLMQFLWKYIEDFVGKGLDLLTIAELLFYVSTTLVPMSLPLAILLASLMTFGNLGENYELTALKAAGMSLQRIMSPLIFLTLSISVGAFFFSNYILPYSNLQVASMLYDINRKQPETNIKTGIFNYSIEGFAIKVMRKSPTTKMMYDFMIYDHSQESGSKRVTLADSGKIHMNESNTMMILTLYDGKNYFDITENKNKRSERSYPMERDIFKKEIISISIDGGWKRTDQGLFKHHFSMMNVSQLEASRDSLAYVFERRKFDNAENLMRSSYFIQKRSRIVQTKRLDSIPTENVIWAKKEYKSKSDTLLVKQVFELVDNDTIFYYKDTKKDYQSTINTDSLYASKSTDKRDQILTICQQNLRRLMQNLDATITQFKNTDERIRRHNIEMHRKYTLAFACVVFFFIGAPLGAIIRKGGLGVPVIVSVVFFIFYYVVSLFGDKIAREGIIPVWQGMWAASFILAPIGALLTYKATTDSALFNMDSYKHKVDKLYRKFIAKKKDDDLTPA